MSKQLGYTDIEYAVNQDGSRGRSWNFYPGCLHKQQGVCPVPHCWAESMSKRQKADFHTPHLMPELLLAPLSIKKPSVILVNFMGDIGGSWIDPTALVDVSYSPLFGENEKHGKFWELECIISDVMFCSSQHTFLFLTKNPAGLIPWGPFPDNAWVGATAWDLESLNDACHYLALTEAKHRWLSIEPLLNKIDLTWFEHGKINWVVIGAQSQPVLYPETDWVENIMWACLDAHVPVWLKENLQKGLPPAPPFYIPPVLPAHKGTPMTFRQERPF